MRLSAVLVVVAFCGCSSDDTNHLADAPLAPDGRTDAPGVDAADLTVKLVMTIDGAPAVGARVYFLNADSSVVSATQTGSDGTASALVAAGGSVTALQPGEGSALPSRLTTFEAVAPGDVLHLDIVDALTSPTVTTFPIVLPADGSDEIELQGTCNADLTIATSTVTMENCGATADFVVLATDDVGTVLGSIFAPAQPIANDQTLTIAGPYVAAAPATVTFTNVPAIVGANIDFGKALLTSRGEVLALGGEATGSGSGSGLVTMTGTLAYPSIASTPGTTQVIDFQPGNRDEGFDDRESFVWGPAAATTTVDLATVALVPYTSNPAFDTTAQTVSISVGSGVTPDGVIAEVNIARDSEILSGWQWTVVAPPGTPTGTVTLPTLPTDVFPYNTTATDEAQVDRLDMLQVPGGYPEIREHTLGSAAFGGPVFGTTGQVLLTSLVD